MYQIECDAKVMVPMTTATATATTALLLTASSLLFLFRRIVYSTWRGFCAYLVPASAEDASGVESSLDVLVEPTIVVPVNFFLATFL